MGGLGFGLTVTLIGLAVVSVVLALLIGIMKMLHVFKEKEKKENQGIAVQQQPQVKAAPEDTELIAVIAAALGMMSAAKQENGLRIRSIRRIGINTPVWNQAGRNDQLFYRF
jgi:sodium pump decarboxylase gamma subunit